MNLVIVESPAKAKTINAYLGSNFKVLASYGHVRDLPSKNGSVDPENNFAFEWETSDKSKKNLSEIYKAAANHPNVKKAFVGSGIRYDMLVPEFNKNADPKDLEEYTEQVVKNHVSGRLKVAPEHTSDDVLKIMRKPMSYLETRKVWKS